MLYKYSLISFTFRCWQTVATASSIRKSIQRIRDIRRIDNGISINNIFSILIPSMDKADRMKGSLTCWIESKCWCRSKICLHTVGVWTMACHAVALDCAGVQLLFCILCVWIMQSIFLRWALNAADLNILWSAGRLLADRVFCLTFSRWLSASQTAPCYREFIVVSKLRRSNTWGLIKPVVVPRVIFNMAMQSHTLAYKKTDFPSLVWKNNASPSFCFSFSTDHKLNAMWAWSLLDFWGWYQYKEPKKFQYHYYIYICIYIRWIMWLSNTWDQYM